MDAAAVMCEFRIGESVELGAGEVPAVESYKDCRLRVERVDM